MTHASVFSGIGGPEVAAVMLGWENLFHCEINPFGRTVLDYWFPNSKSYEDITTTDFSEWRGRVNVLTGGFPCQPFSYAGQRRGAQDDRYLWPYMFRCIDQVQPDWVVAENVAGILTMVEQGEVSEVASSADLFDSLNDIRGYRLRETFTLQRICDDLEGHGYAVQPVLIPACAVGAPHRRDRVFIVARRVEAVSEDTMHGGQLHRPNEEQRSERNERDAGARGGQRLRGETSRTAPTNTASDGRGEGDGHMEPELAERNEPVSDGRQRNVTHAADPRAESVRRERQDAVHELGSLTDTDGEGREERMRSGQQAHRTEEGAGMDNRTQRPCNDRYSANSESEQCTGFELKLSHISQSWETQFRRDSGEDGGVSGCKRWNWDEKGKWLPSQSPIHRGNDGLPFDVDDLTLPFGKWRTEALKAYGNAIVPQVMYEIFRAIDQIERN